MCLYVFLVLFLWLFFLNVVCPALACFFFFYYFVDACLYSNEKEKVFGWLGREEGLGRAVGGKSIIKMYDVGKILFFFKVKNKENSNNKFQSLTPTYNQWMCTNSFQVSVMSHRGAIDA